MGRDVSALADTMATCSTPTNADTNLKSTEIDLSDVEHNLNAEAVARDDDESDNDSTGSDSSDNMTLAQIVKDSVRI